MRLAVVRRLKTDQSKEGVNYRGLKEEPGGGTRLVAAVVWVVVSAVVAEARARARVACLRPYHEDPMSCCR